MIALRYLAILLAMSNPTSAQTVNDLIKLPKDTLVQRAASMIELEGFDVNLFDQISVWRRENEVWVKFDQFVRFVPANGAYYYDAFVTLTGEKSYGASNVGGGKDMERYFVPDREQKETIAKLMEIVRAQFAEGHLEKISDVGQITIYESGSDYLVSVEHNEAQNDTFRINKKSFAVSDKQYTEKILDPSTRRSVRIY